MTLFRKLRARMSFANVTSMMALFVALSGIAWAQSLPKNSVGAKQIRADAVSRSEIKAKAVAGAEVKDRSLTNVETKQNTLTGTELADGGVGLLDLAANSVNGAKVVDASLTGGDVNDGTLAASDLPAGTFLGGSVTVQREQAAADVADGASVSLNAFCPEGQTALGGGYRGDATDSEETDVGSNRPIISTGNGNPPDDNGTFTGWRATIENPAGGVAAGIRPEVWVICAKLP
jgi:hypothetical protein